MVMVMFLICLLFLSFASFVTPVLSYYLLKCIESAFKQIVDGVLSILNCVAGVACKLCDFLQFCTSACPICHL